MKAKFLFFGLALVGFTNAKSQITWNFNSATPTANATTYVTDSVKQGNSKGTTVTRSSANPSMGYMGASGGNNIATTADTGGFISSQTSYFEVTLTPAINTSIVLSGISFGSYSAANGPQAFSVRTSLDNYVTDRAVGSLSANSTWSYTGIQNFNLVGGSNVPVTVRIYGFNGLGAVNPSTSNWRIDDLNLFTAATPLPLTLTSFNAGVTGDKVELVFKTANEKNVTDIVVEKSTDSKNFTSLINFEPKNGASNEYTAVDNVNAGTTYYRLKIVGNDESFTYSNTLKVNGVTSTNPVVSVYPNPAQTNLNVSYTSSDTRIPYSIFTTSGYKVSESSFNANTSSSMIDVSTLPTGHYVLYVNNGIQRNGVVFVRQ